MHIQIIYVYMYIHTHTYVQKGVAKDKFHPRLEQIFREVNERQQQLTEDAPGGNGAPDPGPDLTR